MAFARDVIHRTHITYNIVGVTILVEVIYNLCIIHFTEHD